jgi:hypothetical protein
LSINKVFKKIPKPIHEARKGVYWVIDHNYYKFFEDLLRRQRSSHVHHRNSANPFSSPMADEGREEDHRTTTIPSSRDTADFLCVPSPSLIMKSLPNEFHDMKHLDEPHISSPSFLSNVPLINVGGGYPSDLFPWTRLGPVCSSDLFSS